MAARETILATLLMALLIASGCDRAGGKATEAPTAGNGDAAPSAGNAATGKKIAIDRCRLCHLVEGEGGQISEPLALQTGRRAARMGEYEAYVQQLKVIDSPRYRANEKRIEAILAEQDPGRRLVRWFETYLGNPTFDDANNTMTPLLLAPEEIQDLAAYLHLLAVGQPKSK